MLAAKGLNQHSPAPTGPQGCTTTCSPLLQRGPRRGEDLSQVLVSSLRWAWGTPEDKQDNPDHSTLQVTMGTLHGRGLRSVGGRPGEGPPGSWWAALRVWVQMQSSQQFCRILEAGQGALFKCGWAARRQGALPSDGLPRSPGGSGPHWKGIRWKAASGPGQFRCMNSDTQLLNQ